MTTALFRDFLYDDATIAVNASGTALTITKGDWVAYSGIWAIAANTGIAYYKASGVGIALENNPVYDELGVPRVNTSLTVLRRGVIRASAGESAAGDGSDYKFGVPVRPVTTGSGIVGQTAATGMGAMWQTAAFVGVSASVGALTALVPGGVGILVGIVGGSTGKLDILLSPQRADYI